MYELSAKNDRLIITGAVRIVIDQDLIVDDS